MCTVVMVYGSYTCTPGKIAIIYHGLVASMDTSVRMHSTSHLDYGLIVVYLIVYSRRALKPASHVQFGTRGTDASVCSCGFALHPTMWSIVYRHIVLMNGQHMAHVCTL